MRSEFGNNEEKLNNEEDRWEFAEDEEKGAEEGTETRTEWIDLAAAGPVEVRPGDIVTGIVAGISNEGVSVDLGAKLEGLIPRAEFASDAELPRVDEEIEVCVVKIDEEAGIIKLSKRRADFARLWKRLEEAVHTGEPVDGMVLERVKGGLRVDVGVPAFVPASQVSTRDVRNLERFVGQSLRFKVVEADRQTKKVILSHRQYVEEEREKRRQETLAKLEEGAIVEGKVRSLTSYGAFVDLGGVDGLLHVSEITWTRINHPSEALKVGQKVTVTVLEINPATNKISLSMRQIMPDPWKEAARKLKPGQLVRAKITRLVRTGAFAQLPQAGGIEGFIPISELSQRRVSDPSEVLSEGQEVDLKIQEIKIEARRMTLSLIAAEQEKERQEYQAYMQQQQKARLTLGERLGDVFQQLKVSAVESELQPPAPAAESSSATEKVETADAAAQIVHAAEGEEAAESAQKPQQPKKSAEEATLAEDTGAEIAESPGGAQANDEDGLEIELDPPTGGDTAAAAKEAAEAAETSNSSTAQTLSGEEEE